MGWLRFGRSGGFLGGGWANGRGGVAGATTAKLWACGVGSLATAKVAWLEPAPEPIPAGGWSLPSREKPDILSEETNIESGENRRF